MGYTWRFILGALGIIAVIVFIIALIFGGSNDDPSSTNTTTEPQKLSDYASRGAEVSFNYDGVISAAETHRSILITVNVNNRSVVVFKGYNNEVVKRKDYPNTSAGFATFLDSLENSGFTTERESKTGDDPSGQCPLGLRYIFTRTDAPSDTTLWTTTCGSAAGTFAGPATTNMQLFQKQIPDYVAFTTDVNLYAAPPPQ